MPASAVAAVTIGSPLVAPATNNAPAGRCMTASCTYTQTDATLAAAPQYVVPAGIANGVITSWSFKASSGDNAIQVLRLQGGGAYLDVGHSEVVLAAGSSTSATSATRVPVKGGDAIGLFNDSNALVMNTNMISLPASNVVRTFDPAVSTTTPSSPLAATPNSQLELQATIESDADGDGYGDETQDDCTNDPGLHTACSSDLQVTGSGAPTSLKAGRIAHYTYSVRNVGSSPATNAGFAVTLPGGAQPGSMSSSIGSCGAFTCALGTLLKGTTATISFSVATLKVGTLTVTGRGASTVADPNPSNNSASVSTTVTHPDLVLNDLSVYPRRFTRGNGLPRVSGRSMPHPTAIKFSLSEAATVRFAIARIGTRNHALNPRAFAVQGRAGANRVIFAGVLPGHVKLRAGHYRLTASAMTADGRRARSASVLFAMLVKPRR
jgi:uncharacterized repeat protein (TIGR01451 family)